MSSNSDKFFLVLFCFGVLGIFGGIGVLRYPLILASNQGTSPTTQEITVSQKESEIALQEQASVAAVLGEVASSESCISSSDYTKSLKHVRPEIALYFGTEELIVSAAEILSCGQYTPQFPQGSSCKSYQLGIDIPCLQQILEKNIRFAQPQETLKSKQGNKTVQARINDHVVDYESLAQQVAELYISNSEFSLVTGMYTTIKPMVLQVPVLKDLPNTDGQFAQKYLEFDGSRQLMFMWEKGNYKKFRISGAFPEYNPVGVYEILNKSPLAWSSTADKWMPYWQAFTYDSRQKAMLGIHALVYWYPGFQKTGDKKIFEPETNIGKPRSTGCLRLTISDAKKVFEWSKVGDLIVVHN